MRVLWISHTSRLGGAELGLAEGIDALDARGHTSTVVLPGRGPLADRLARSEVRYCHHTPWVGPRQPALRTVRWITHDLTIAGRAIARIARQVSADVVLSNTMTVFAGAVASKYARMPHAWFLHEFGDGDHGLSFLLGRRITFAAMRRLGNAFVVNSMALRRHYETVLDPDRVHNSAYSVPVRETTRHDQAGDTGLHLILVGSKVPSKGQLDAIAAIALLRDRGLDVKLDLVGGGDPQFVAELATEIARRGLADVIQLIGPQPNTDPLVAAADIALMCSPNEALGRVTIEAMKHGLPVVGARGGATPELIRDGWNGYLYRPGDPADLAGRIEELYHSRETIRNLGLNGQAWADQAFNIERYGETLEAALQAAIERHGK